MNKLFDIVLSILEIVILIIGIFVFTGVFSLINDYTRFIFMFLDFYCGISLIKSIEEFVELFKVKSNTEIEILDDVYNME